MADLQWGVILTQLGGGLALFLYGMRQMTESLKTVAGDGMKNLLASLTTNRFTAAFAGAVVTAVIQSSSVTTVLVVGFITAGLMSLAQSVGIIMGANIGTTITAILASFSTGNPAAITVAFAHLSFNILGIALLYPFKFIPIGLAEWCGKLAAKSKGDAARVIAIYIVLHIIPILYVILR